MTGPPESDSLRREILRLEDARHILTERAERTLTALALTLDAQAATQLRLEVVEGTGPDGVARLEASAHRCREILREIGDAAEAADATSDEAAGRLSRSRTGR